MKKVLLASAFLLATAGVASSADAVLEYASAPAYDWTGAYFGGFVGYGFGDTEHRDGDATTGDLDIEGAIAGVTLGYNVQQGNFVYGAEADIAWSGIDGSHGPALFNPGPNSFNCGSGPCETEVDWLATVRARIGYAFDNILPYITGGVAIGGVDARIPNAPTLQDGESTEVGWTAGAGLEYGFTPNWTAKIEYLYVDLGEWDYDDGSSDFSATAEFSTVKFGINYRF